MFGSQISDWFNFKCELSCLSWNRVKENKQCKHEDSLPVCEVSLANGNNETPPEECYGWKIVEIFGF